VCCYVICRFAAALDVNAGLQMHFWIYAGGSSARVCFFLWVGVLFCIAFGNVGFLLLYLLLLVISSDSLL
jgi:hypothetical protein